MSDFVLLSEGNYFGRVIDWDLGESPAKGTPYFSLTIRLTSQDTEDENGKPIEMELDEPAVRKSFMYLSKGALPITTSTLKKFGWDGDVDKLDPAHDEALDFSNVEVKVKVTHEEYNDKTQERLRVWKRVKKTDAATKAKILEQMKAAVEEYNAEQKAQEAAEAELEQSIGA